MFFKRLIIVIIESIILLALDPKKNILIYWIWGLCYRTILVSFKTLTDILTDY